MYVHSSAETNCYMLPEPHGAAGWPQEAAWPSSMGVVGLELPYGSFQGSLALVFDVAWTCPNSISITGKRIRTRESPNESQADGVKPAFLARFPR